MQRIVGRESREIVAPSSGNLALANEAKIEPKAVEKSAQPGTVVKTRNNSTDQGFTSLPLEVVAKYHSTLAQELHIQDKVENGGNNDSCVNRGELLNLLEKRPEAIQEYDVIVKYVREKEATKLASKITGFGILGSIGVGAAGAIVGSGGLFFAAIVAFFLFGTMMNSISHVEKNLQPPNF